MWIIDGLKRLKDSDIPAIVERTGTLSFKEIWNRSECVGQEILEIEKDTGEKTPVVIYGDKDPDMVAVMLAALKTGRAYIPVDVSFPVERLEYISKTVNASVIYNFSGHNIEVPFEVRNGIFNAVSKYDGADEISDELYVKKEDICYILFTSGSTGLPKGVPITRNNLENFVDWFTDEIKPEKYGQNVLIQTSYSFDASVEILYVYLTYGKTLVCVDKGLTKDIGALIEWISENKIAIWSSTPSFFEMCAQHNEFNGKTMPSMKLFIAGGEVLTKKTAKYLIDSFPEAILYNSYGPTEATVEVSACPITEEMFESEFSLPIGRIMPEAKASIVGEDGSICKDGEVGELVVVSRSVASGYYKDPVKTAKAFFKAEDGRMGFKTGDLCFIKNGYLYFAGRKDFQVKLHGYRVEIDDISNNLDKISLVKKNVVIPVYDGDGKVDYLAAFIVVDKDNDFGSPLKNLIAVKKELSGYVPSYMVPRKIVFVDEMPLNNNGKADRKELLKLL